MGIAQPLIIAVTAHTEPDHEKKCLDAGMDRVLHKPVKAETLRGIIESTKSYNFVYPDEDDDIPD